MENKVPAPLAALFNKILVDFNKQQIQPQVTVPQPVITPVKKRMLRKPFAGGIARRNRPKNKRRQQAFKAAQYFAERQAQNFEPAPVFQDAMVDVGGAAPVMNVADLGPQGYVRRGPANGRSTWHPLHRVKQSITHFLPRQYWSQYNMHYDFGPGRPSGNTVATKIKWRKLLGDVFSINGWGRVKYTKLQGKRYDNVKRWKQAVGRRAGWRRGMRQ